MDHRKLEPGLFDPDGRRLQLLVEPKEADAKRLRTSIEHSLNVGEYVDPRLGKTKFEDWVAQWEAGRLNRRPSTRARDDAYFWNLILPTFTGRTLARIQPSDVKAWISRLDSEGYAPATTRKAYQLLAACLEEAVEDGLIPRSPCRNPSLPRLEKHEMRFLTADEIAHLAHTIEPRYQTLVLTAAYTGLRAGELAALRVSDLELLKRRLRVNATLSWVRGHAHVGPTKTASSRRTISLPLFIVDALAEHLAEDSTESGFVFSAPGGGPIRWSNFRRRQWAPAVEQSVGQPCRFHDLRHTHAALLIAAGEHVKVIQQRLGHSSAKTTLDTYGHVFDGLDEAAADRLDEVFLNSTAEFLPSIQSGSVVELHP